MVDPSQIEQVIVNLVVNAQDAMPQGGKLTLRTRTTSIAPRSRKAALQLDPGTYVKLSVIDTGVGLDGATKHRVFEPFFTTKSIGKGTGLGLATVYGIVKQALGEVTVDSKPGEGATFTVYLPATEQAALPHVGESRSDRLPVGSETLLLCEDDKLVRRLAQRMLLTAGYNVLVASNGAEALELAEKHSDRIHMLVTDIVMPDMNGRQVADALTKRFTDLKVLYVSGYTSNVIAHHGVLEDGVELLSKPFTYHGLLTRVRAILDR
jgi:CheY-like chemotaxis protein